ncbi:MAG: phosphatase PAP2 family protein [Parvularculaceae bacterium]
MTNTETGLKAARKFGLAAVALACVIVFLAIAGVVTGGTTQSFDEGFLRGLRTGADLSTPAGPAFLTPLAHAATDLGGTPFLATLTILLAVWFAVRREWRFLAILLAAVLGETVLSSGLKSMFDRPRPEVVPHLVHVSSKSFPSGHASSAAAVFLTLAALVAAHLKERSSRLFAFAAGGALAFLVGASRVYLGVHYPTDVIGGWSFGAAWAAIVWIAARRFQR